jgi:hypothetical protein
MRASIVKKKSILIFAALFLFAASPAYAVVNGVPVTDKPDLVRIDFQNGASICSGFFIDAYTVVTSAHCLFSDAGTPWKPSEVFVIFSTGAQMQAVSLVGNPAYVKDDVTHDIAVIKTFQNGNFAGNFKLVSEGEPQVWGKVDIYGGGRTDLNDNKSSFAQGSAPYVRTDSALYSIGRSGGSDNPGIWSSIAPNDSGGPVTEQGTDKVIAVASRTTVMSTKNTPIPAISTSCVLTNANNHGFVMGYLGVLRN